MAKKPKAKPKAATKRAKPKVKPMAKRSKADQPEAVETIETTAQPEPEAAPAAPTLPDLPPEAAAGEEAYRAIQRAEGSLADKWLTVARALAAIERAAAGNKEKAAPKVLGAMIARTSFAAIPSPTRSDAKWLLSMDVAADNDPRENATGLPMAEACAEAGIPAGHPSNMRNAWRAYLVQVAKDRAKAEAERLANDPEAKAEAEAEAKAKAEAEKAEKARKAALNPEELAKLADKLAGLGKKAAKDMAMTLATLFGPGDNAARFRDFLAEPTAEPAE